MSLILEGLHADEWYDFPDFVGKKGIILVLDSESWGWQWLIETDPGKECKIL